MKIIKIIVPLILLIMLCGCETNQNEITESEHKGKCLEYKTEYRLDCGFFVDSDSFCKERKYDVCVRWEEE